jgi:hypothetical protein
MMDYQHWINGAASAKEAGLSDGVINVVTETGPDLGPALVEHPDVAMIAAFRPIRSCRVDMTMLVEQLSSQLP